MSDVPVLSDEEQAVVTLLRLRVSDRTEPYQYSDQELLGVYQASNESIDLASLQVLRAMAASSASVVDFEEEGAVRRFSQVTTNLTALIRTYQQSLGSAANDVSTESRTPVAGRALSLRDCYPVGRAFPLRDGTFRG